MSFRGSIYEKYKNKTFAEVLTLLFGKVVAKIIFFVFTLFFLLKCWAIFQSSFVFLNENLYSTYNWFTFAFPILATIVLCSMQGTNACARVVEVFFFIALSGATLALVVGVFRSDFSNLLPILEDFSGKASKLFSYSFWFGDYLCVILFFNNIKMDKKFFSKVLIVMFGFVLFATVFYAEVYATYSYGIVNHTNSISDILQFLPSSSDIGNFDWILILIWDIVLVLVLIVNLLCATYSFSSCVRSLPQVWLSIGACVVIFALGFMFKFDIYSAVNLAENVLFAFSIAVQYVLPLLIFVVGLLRRKKNEVLSA